MALKTVRVPPDIEPVFAKAEEVVARYFAARQEDPSQGTIEIFGERYVMVRAAALSVEFFSLVRSLFGKGREAEAEEFARNILFDLAHAIGKSDARDFHAKMDLTDPIARLSAGPVHFAHSGWAFVDISPESRPSPDEEYYLIYDHPYSFEADAWLRAGRKASFPVCIMNAGYSSGWCEESFGVTLVASEILCRAKGDDCCRFIMAPPNRIAEHIERYMKQKPKLAPRMRSYRIPDFLQRKRVEEALRRSEEQYRGIFEASVDALVILDRDGVVVDANPAACATYGYRREEVIGLSGQKLVHSDCHGLFEQFKRQVAAEGELHVEAMHVRKDGTTFHSEVRGSRLHYRGSLHLLAVVRDITRRKRTARTLQESEERYRLLFENANDVVCLLDPDLTFLSVSPSLEAVLGYKPDEFVGSRLSEVDVATPATLEAMKADAQRILAGQRLHFSVYELAAKDGGSRFVEASGQPLIREGRPAGVVVVVRDITERRQAEEALKQARDAAEAANLAKSQFLANMSHEIRTPLTAILGYADLLKDPTLGPADRDDHLAVIGRSGQHLLELINGILDLSRVEAGKLRVQTGPCRLAPLVAEAADTMRVQAEQRGIALTTQYVGELPETIRTDGGRLRQVLSNLVGNAIKFTERGGVRIVTSFLPSWRNQEPAVQIQVIDTGIGIGEGQLPAVFEPFVQADGSTARKYGGTGLGLAIANQIAALLGGELVARSALGEGSTFTVTVPTGGLEGVRMLREADDSPREPAPARDAEAETDLAGTRILLAEDGVDNQSLIRALLRKAGAEVEVARNGRIALDMAAAESFDVILMDMQMPEMDGYAATRALRGRGHTGVVLALTAYAMSGDRERCLAAGCDDYLTKPIRRGPLVEAIARYAGRPRRVADRPARDRGGIQSEFADDREMAAIIDEFVAGLPGRVRAMREALANGCLRRLQRQAHQLKGAGGSYGYQALTDAAKVLTAAAEARDVETAALALNRLADLCRAVVSARPAGASAQGQPR